MCFKLLQRVAESRSPFYFLQQNQHSVFVADSVLDRITEKLQLFEMSASRKLEGAKSFFPDKKKLKKDSDKFKCKRYFLWF